MKIIVAKCKLIFLPLLLLTVVFVCFYTLLNWLWLIFLETCSIKHDVIHELAPLGLAFLLIIFWFDKRISLLNLSKTNNKLFGIYQMISVLIIALPTWIAQDYLEKACGRLQPLDSIWQIEKRERAKYYTLKDFYIDKEHIGVYRKLSISGKYNSNLDMNLYIVLPILANQADVNYSNCIAWLGIRYSKTINNSLSMKEKQEKYKQFLDTSQIDFNNRDLNKFVYLDRIGNTTDHYKYNKAILNNTKYEPMGTIVLLPVNTPFEERLRYPLLCMLASFIIPSSIFFLLLLCTKLDEEAVAKFKSRKTNKT